MRAPLHLIAQDPETGDAIPGATALIKDRGVLPAAALDPSEIFTSPDGPGTVATNPVVMNANGMATVWLERRQLVMEWSGGLEPTFADVLPAGDGGIDAHAIDPAGFPPADGLQRGVVRATDLVVTRNSSSQVTLAAGRYWVPTPAGVLVPVTLAAATVLAGIPVAAAAQFRLDQVTVDYTGTVRYRQGTSQSAGTTLDNRTGAFVFPDGEMVVKDFLAGADGVVESATRARDRRSWAQGFDYASHDAGGGLYANSSSGAAVPLDVGRFTRRFESSGGPCVVEFGVARLEATAPPGAGGFDLMLNGALNARRFLAASASPGLSGSLRWVIPASVPGSRRLELNWFMSAGGTLSLYQLGMTYSIREILSPQAFNGSA